MWAPAVDKRALDKAYDTFVEPIVLKTYSDSPRFDESYTLIYEPFNPNTALLTPLDLEIPEGLSNGTAIGKVVTQNNKSFVNIELTGDYAEYFSISEEGIITVVQSHAIHSGDNYRFRMRAIDTAEREGSFVSLSIKVNDTFVQETPGASVPVLVSLETFDITENTPEGTIVANTQFEDSNQTIVEYKLIGYDSKEFVVNNEGVVSVGFDADIDYEKSKVYRFSISAVNDVGNESYPLSISINVDNEIDTPLYPLVFFTHVEENTDIGTVIGHLDLLREGKSTIDGFDILSPNIPFEIDNNGTIIISDYLDYEQRKEYRFIAIATSKHGNSNKIECQVYIDDQTPELGVPTLEDITITVDENIISGTKIGQLVLNTGATGIERIAFYGEDDNFRVDSNGSIYLADHASLDYERKTQYILGARALNSRGYGNEVKITIEVKNIADALPIFALFRKSIEENAFAQMFVGTLSLLSSGESNITGFTLTGTGSENFTIDVNGTIQVSSSATLDYETVRRYALQATVLSNTREGKPIDVRIYILNIAEHVPVLKPFTGSIEENASIGTIVGQIEEDVGGDSPIVSYVLDDNSTFSIDDNGTISVNSTLDYERQTTYTLAVRASNVLGQSSPVTVTINITNILDDEPALNGANFTVSGDSTVGITLGTVELNSTGTSAITSMALVGIGAEKFSINANGIVKLVETVDYESKKVYHLRAIASNSKADSAEVDIIIEVLNVAEIIPLLNTFTRSMEETIAIDTILGSIEVLHVGDTVIDSYEINGTSRVYVDNNGRIFSTSEINWSIANVIHFEIRAHNGAGWSDWTIGDFRILHKFYLGDASNNNLLGSQRDEVFNGGLGNDTLEGKDGDDIYLYTLGDGNDTILDSYGEDTLILHQIDREKLHFEVDGNDMILVFENNQTIRISNWGENNYKIEYIKFDDDTEITLYDFNNPIATPDVAIADLSKLGNINAAKVVQGFIEPIGNGRDKVDHWVFDYIGGELIIDTLSELNNNGHSYIDIDGDGLQLGVDIYIYFYKKDGNGQWTQIASNDDSSKTYGDGSSHTFDSYLKLSLEEGEYLLAVGNYSLSSTSALAGSNSAGSYPKGGAYQITFNHELDFIEIPDGSNGDVYGTNHFNYYVLKNDIDPYNINGLSLLNPIIYDESATQRDDYGHVEIIANALSFYPDENNNSREVNIVYDIQNQNDIICKSMLTIDVIQSLYTHVDTQLNQNVWQMIQEESCFSELNVTQRR